MRVYVLVAVDKDCQGWEEAPEIQFIFSTLKGANTHKKRLEKMDEDRDDVEYRVDSWEVLE